MANLTQKCGECGYRKFSEFSDATDRCIFDKHAVRADDPCRFFHEPWMLEIRRLETELKIYKRFWEECFEDDTFFIRCADSEEHEECAIDGYKEKLNCASCLLNGIRRSVEQNSKQEAIKLDANELKSKEPLSATDPIPIAQEATGKDE